MNKTGLAFSGGGIRSAAFCSGVLRRLLQKNVKIDYLSCVSGGGYTGTAYLDWKCRNGKKDGKTWHQEFFNHMRQNAGFICHWYHPFKGVLECLAITLVLLFVTILVPALLWMSFSYPLAYVIDYLYGHILRSCCAPCSEVVLHNPNITIQQCEEDRESSGALYHLLALFLTPTSIACASFVLKGISSKGKPLFNLLFHFSAAFFALVFFPWFIKEFFHRLPTWIKFLIFIPLFCLWISFPPIRSSTTLMTATYLSSFVIYWRVYNESAFGFEYKPDTFNIILALATIVHWISPWLITIQQRLVHIYIRWIIQKAFFYPETIGACGCAGISWRSFFLYCPTCCQPKKKGIRHSKVLTLDDLDEMTPQYIGCVTSNQWRRSTSPREQDSELLTMSPVNIERLDRPEGEEELRGRLTPMDIYLSDVAATSAAALNHQTGSRHGDELPFKDFKVMFGLSCGSSFVSDQRQEKKRHFCIQVLPLIIEFIRGLPLAVFFVIYLITDDGDYLTIGLLIFFSILLLLTLVALVPTGSRKHGRLERIARWLTVNVYYVNFIRNAMKIANEGPSPPAVLSLSDGGHIENLGILPLLKLRLKKIVSVDGSRTILDQDYGSSLMTALDLARRKLGCSFSGMDGRDIAEDMRDNFVERRLESQPRSYRFKVYYYDKNPNGDGKTRAGEGEIIYIRPRHPDKGSTPTLRCEEWNDVDIDLERSLWGTGPELSAEEADRLTFCCCECCHEDSCRGFSEAVCGAFPQHVTINQCFSPSMFSAYHREGYRSSMEAKVEEFMSDEDYDAISTAFVV